MDRSRLGKGISTAFISFMISLVVLVVSTYVILNMMHSAYTSSIAFRNIVRYSHSHEIHQLVLNKTMNSVEIKNIGSSDIVIDKMIIKDYTGSIQVVDAINIVSQGICSSYVIPTYRAITCRRDYEYIAIVTPGGTVVDIHEPLIKAYAVRANTTYMISITFDNIKSPEDLQEIFDVDRSLIAKPYTRDRAQVRYRGVKSSKLLLLPPGQEAEFINATVETESSGVAFGVAVIGYDPSWVREKMNKPNEDIPPRFTIMIAGPGFTGQEKITIGGKQYTLTGNGYRIVINNYTGVIQIKKGSTIIACSSTVPSGCSGIALPAIGAWYYGTTDSSINLRIYLNGFATYVARFMRMASGQSVTGESSYYPYLFIGDIDGNGLNEIIFITEDAYYGDSSRINDMYRNDDLSDWTTVPLTLKLLQIGRALGSDDGSIDGSVYSGVVLYMNIFFHDNSHPDENQLGDIDRTDWVLRILLIDRDNNEYIVREYRYQEICNYHKTRVTDFGRDNYFVKISQSIYVPLPSTGRYWIAVAFQDSYSYERRYYGTRPGQRNVYFINDVDFTVGLEFIGVVPFYR
ncbi:MAG: hypothetical protein QXX89_02695 [Ignisphaera sp.]